MLQSNATLKSLIASLWNSFWAGGIANPLTAIEQITYLIFMKRLDDLETKRENDALFTGEAYASRFQGEYEIPGTNEKIDKDTLRWKNFKRKPAEEMLMHVQTKVFPFLKELNGGSPFTKSMANAVFLMPKPSLLVESVKTIDAIFEEIGRDASEGGHAFQDIQGDVYEMLLSEIAQAGKNGQFRTPRHIIKMMAELVQPQLGHLIADPSCGTGGFLLGAYQYMLTDLARQKGGRLTKDDDGFEQGTLSAVVTEDVKTIFQQSLCGFDIDTTMVRLGLMNLMMHGIDAPQIDYKDTLSKGFDEESRYDIVLANPPFTGNIDKGDINESLTLPTTKTELLFVERIFRMLRMGGTAAIIVPQGVLFGSGKAFVAARKMLVDKAELKAVITLPSGVFKPYAGVSTAILLFTKGGETLHTWFYEMRSDGYSLDDKRNKLGGYGDLQNIIQAYRQRTPSVSDRSKPCFFIEKAEIVANDYDLSLSKYKEEVYEEAVYETPSVILKKLNVLEADIQKELKELEGFLK